MKYLFSLFILIGLASCSNEKKSDKHQSLDISTEMDTVKVDAGDELIYVNWSLSSSGEYPDGKYLYNFKRTKPIALEILNLETLNLEKIIPMDLEGPNGLGTEYISKVHPTLGGNFIFRDGYQVSTFDNDLKKISSYRLDKEEFILESLPEGLRVWLDQALSNDGKVLAAFYGGQNMTDPKEGLIVIDFEAQKAQIFPLESLKTWIKYQTTFLYSGQPMNATFPPNNILVKGDSVVFSIGAENKVYFLDLKTDSISHKTYESQFTSQVSQALFPETVDSEEKFQEIFKEKLNEVRYGNFHFDEKNQVYWRFTMESPKAVLTAFSTDFEQLGEILLDEKFKLPSKVFVRDGMIYTFLNQDDEVYFVRLKPQIKY